jgi:hypothetical protein
MVWEKRGRENSPRFVEHRTPLRRAVAIRDVKQYKPPNTSAPGKLRRLHSGHMVNTVSKVEIGVTVLAFADQHVAATQRGREP